MGISFEQNIKNVSEIQQRNFLRKCYKTCLDLKIIQKQNQTASIVI